MDRYQAAWAVLEVATANMYAQLTPLLAKHGVDPAEYAFLPYGGAGPTHVFLLAREVGIARVVVPPLPGALCALGCLVADLRADFVGTLNVESTHAEPARSRDRLPGAGGAGAGVGDGRGPARRRSRRSCGPRRCATRASRSRSTCRCRRARSRTWRPSWRPSMPRTSSCTATSIGPRPWSSWTCACRSWGRCRDRPPPPGSAVVPRLADPPDTRRVYLDGGFVDAGVFQRAALRPGDGFAGPAVVEQYDTHLAGADRLPGPHGRLGKPDRGG